MVVLGCLTIAEHKAERAELEGARRSEEEPGGARRSQEEPENSGP